MALNESIRVTPFVVDEGEVLLSLVFYWVTLELYLAHVSVEVELHSRNAEVSVRTIDILQSMRTMLTKLYFCKGQKFVVERNHIFLLLTVQYLEIEGTWNTDSSQYIHWFLRQMWKKIKVWKGYILTQYYGHIS